MKGFRIKPLLALAVLVGILLAVGVLSFAGPCMHEDGTAAVCATAAHALIIEGVIAFAAGIVGSMARSQLRYCICAFIVTLCGAFVLFTPGKLFSLRLMQTMRCWTLMRPFALLFGAVLVITGIVAVLFAGKTSVEMSER